MADQPAVKSTAQRMRESVFCITKEFGLTRGERIEVAAYVLNREVESFRDLSVPELCRVLDAFQGAKYIATIKMERRRGQRR